MSIKDMSVEELKSVKITSVSFGKDFAEAILLEQKAIHLQMVDLYDNSKWKVLSDRHYDLRKIRQATLHLTGLMAIEQKRQHRR
jgi:hypothetical protein